jgi:2,3-bisphosphoglycerate-independent phosphoglycerate mutase
MKKMLFVILDGYGLGKDPAVSAIARAKQPYLDSLFESKPWTWVNASGEYVGLPDGQMGNSEVGHMNIGAGRIVWQDITRIDHAVKTGQIKKNETLNELYAYVKKNNAKLHVMGLFSDGGVHSHLRHLYALLETAKEADLEKVFVHAFMDGRDTPPKNGVKYVRDFLDKSKEIGIGTLATITGRYYAMDRDKRWERTEKAYRMLTAGEGKRFDDPVAAMEASYNDEVTDEFVLPVILTENDSPVALIENGDAVLFFNFRTDRPRQLTTALTDPSFTEFTRDRLKLHYVTMTPYHKEFTFPVVFEPQSLDNTMGEYIAAEGMTQLRIAETEKYPHVTFFFSGGREKPFDREDRILVPSPRDVPTYDHKPEMSAYEVTDEAVRYIKDKKPDLVVLNYANPDMVGHSGVMEAAVKAVETVDACTKKVTETALQLGYSVVITADHGNADIMIDTDGGPHTAHTTNPVPFIVIHDGFNGPLREGGKLGDYAPTMLELMGLPVPKEMDGESILETTDRGTQKKRT